MAIDVKTSVDLLIFGAGGHAKVASDCAKKEYQSLILVSGDDNNEEWNDIPIIPEHSKTYDQWKQICNKAFVAIGNAGRREMVTEMLEELGFEIVKLIHPTAVISPSATLEAGVLVGPNAIINADAYISKGTIINTGVIVEHECCVGKYSHLSPGSILCGGTQVGQRCWICTGATLSDHIKVDDNSIVGAGAVVISDLPDHIEAMGVPAKIYKKLDI